MSSHCYRYPKCGCGPDVGTKCGFPDDHKALSEGPEEKKPVDIEALKREAYEDAKRKDMGRKPKRKYPTNYTPPKRRHRKKK